MKKPMALVVPFRFPGYRVDVVGAQTKAAEALLRESGLDLVMADEVVTDRDADALGVRHSPSAVDFVILLVPTWIEPPLVVRAVRHYQGKPVLLWGFTTFQHEGWRVHIGGMAGSGATHGSLKALGIPHRFIIGMPDRPGLKEKIRDFAVSARATCLMGRAKIGMVGYIFSGMHAGDPDSVSLRERLGPEIVHIDTYSLVKRMEVQDESGEEYRKAREKILASLAPGSTLEPAEVVRISRMYAALDQIYREKELDAITVKCNYELSQEFGQSACIPLSVLGNSLVASCEADLCVTVTQLLLHYLADGAVTTYADIHDLAEGKALIGACGYAPSTMCAGNCIVVGKPPAAAAGLAATFSGWIVNSSAMKSGQVTLARLARRADRFTLHYATGEALGDVGKVSEMDCPAYPTTEIALNDINEDRFLQNSGSHHYAVVYKDVAAQIESYCQVAGIEVLAG